MANPSPSPPHPHHAASGCTPQRTLIRFATLLGTFSLDDGGVVSDGGSGKSKEHSASCAAQSGQALRSLLGPDSENSVPSISSFPSLSLDSAAHHDHPVGEPRSKVEGLASTNLARPIIVVARENAADGTGDSTDSDVGPRALRVEKMTVWDMHEGDSENEAEDDETRLAVPVSDVALVPSLMIGNLTASFALLIDARLRAYGTILTRHAASLVQASEAFDVEEENGGGGGDDDGNSSVGSAACIVATERKLSALIEIGEDVRMDGVVTALHVRSADGGVEARGQQAKKCGDKEVVGMPLVFEAVVDVSVPNLVEGGRDRMTINIKAPGEILGYFDEGSDHAHLRSVHVHVDTHALLASMVDQACTVVSKVVDNVNASSKHQAALASDPATAELTSDSDVPAEVGEAIPGGGNDDQDEARVEDEEVSGGNDASMPPPEPRVPPADGPLHLPIVSPSLESTVPGGEAQPAPLRLSKQKQRRDSLTLTGSTPESAEKCAAIVDYVMGEVDEQSWVFPPLAKRTKTSHAVY